MFYQYQNVNKRYILLLDVKKDTLESNSKLVFRYSRQFKQGQTLQKLLASLFLKFFSKERAQLENRELLKRTIYKVIEVSIKALLESNLSNFSVAKRFIQIDNYQIIYKEDSVYYLLDILSVYLLLIYSKGRENVFKQLKSVVILK